MHASIQKPFNEILQMMDGEEKIFIVGCGTCATYCHSGGEPEVAEMKEKLEKEGKVVTGAIVPGNTCSFADDLLLIEENQAAIDDADGILVMSCGQGVNAFGDATDRPTHAACNTIFGGGPRQPGDVHEYCQACGECVADDYGGICPMTRCAKGLLNGPCGGATDGKCEVNPERDCAWELIYSRLKKAGKLDKIFAYKEPKDFQPSATPRRLLVGAESGTSSVFYYGKDSYSPKETEE